MSSEVEVPAPARRRDGDGDARLQRRGWRHDGGDVHLRRRDGVEERRGLQRCDGDEWLHERQLRGRTRNVWRRLAQELRLYCAHGRRGALSCFCPPRIREGCGGATLAFAWLLPQQQQRLPLLLLMMMMMRRRQKSR